MPPAPRPQATQALDTSASTPARYKETLAWLFGTQLFGIKLGLENIERLLRELEVPSDSRRIIHVAGTNGKGSTCAIIDAICRAAGYRTGLFTSPHLVTYRERIQVNGAMISKSAVAQGLADIRERIRGWDPHPTFFEITTALALQHFERESCEIIVLETGMGGRLDATNAITPVVSVITPIDYDHQKWLGNSLAEIAAEKAGIIKPRVPVVSAPQPAEAAHVIALRATECEAPLQVESGSFSSPQAALEGKHQQQNAAVAVAALRAAQIEVPADAITAGIAAVTWPARFQRWNDRIIIDGAHNPAGARTLAATWREVFGAERATIILAVLRDKDVAGIVEALIPLASGFILPKARTERAVPREDLAALILSAAPEQSVTVADSLAAAVEQAASERLLVTGSLHFAGEALALFGGDPDALEDCLQ